MTTPLHATEPGCRTEAPQRPAAWRIGAAHPRRVGLGHSGTSGCLQQHAQPLQASPTGGANAPDRQPQLVGYLRVGSWRIGHEQLDQPSPSPRKAGESVANGLGALFGEKPLVDL